MCGHWAPLAVSANGPATYQQTTPPKQIPTKYQKSDQPTNAPQRSHQQTQLNNNGLSNGWLAGVQLLGWLMDVWLVAAFVCG